MIAASLLLLAQVASTAAETPSLVIEEGTNTVFNCDDTDLNKAEASVCAADECDDPQTQLAMNMCTLADYQRADAELNAQWEVTAAAMKARDATLDAGDGQPGYFETLLEGQRAWLKFRDAQCLSESFMARGGSMQPMVAAQCKAYVTDLRTEQLRVLAAGPEGQ